MTDLIDRISGEGGEKIPIHQFFGVLRLFAGGVKTLAEIKAAAQSMWNLTGDELSQAQELADNVSSKSSGIAKVSYILRIEAIAMLLESGSGDTLYYSSGDVDKSVVKTDMELS